MYVSFVQKKFCPSFVNEIPLFEQHVPQFAHVKLACMQALWVMEHVGVEHVGVFAWVSKNQECGRNENWWNSHMHCVQTVTCMMFQLLQCIP